MCGHITGNNVASVAFGCLWPEKRLHVRFGDVTYVDKMGVQIRKRVAVDQLPDEHRTCFCVRLSHARPDDHRRIDAYSIDPIGFFGKLVNDPLRLHFGVGVPAPYACARYK